MKLIYNYGGNLNHGRTIEYVGGNTCVLDDVDPDKIGYFDLLDWAKDCGDYPPVTELYYAKPGCDLGKGLKRIYGDKETIEMVTDGEESGNVICLYVVHQTKNFSACASNQNRRDTSPVVDKIQQSKIPMKAFSISTFCPSHFIEEEMVQSTELDISEEDSHDEEEEGEDTEELTGLNKGNRIETCVEDEILGSSSNTIMRDLEEEMPNDEVLLGSDSDTDDEECRDARRKFNDWHDKENAKVDGIVNFIIQTPNPTLGAATTEARDLVSEYEDSDEYANTPGERMRFPNRELFRDAVRRKWDLTGIPCHHATACIYFLNHKPEDYVDDFYSKSSYMKTYEHSILPCVGEKHWPKAAVVPLDPPPIKIGPGRPRKNRVKDPYEDPKKPGSERKPSIEAIIRRFQLGFKLVSSAF
ncbi:unnamed protein product [Cuscuta campestris]|uniref:PB1-like domain-containing protein n=1 Tax=Cuscuta campestris TaxID=132261 RepID=A0A484NMF1_9ASTE|nr:unnamed protein product [Cuscuta campestris]